MHNISKKLINSINYEEFKSIINDNNSSFEDLNKVFYEKPGKEHYRLLSYFSTLYNNSTILDIRTHRGSSALALSYNKTNTVITFDIVNNVLNQNIKNRENIFFCNDNLFQEDSREKWETTILSCPFIFLDIDPHNGYMEFDFYNYLKNIGYNGFVICDDIWYFKEMRDNFWSKIPEEYKYDITKYGHWSGTGIFTFNKNISFFKYNISNWTLVTAYFNLSKCSDITNANKRGDKSLYFNSCISLLSTNCNLVIYCDPESVDEIKNYRPNWLADKTKYIVKEFDDFIFENNNNEHIENFIKENGNITFHNIRNKILQNYITHPYNQCNRTSATYYLFCMLRYIILKETINTNPFGSTHFGWINFCIERMGFKNLIYLNESLSINRDKFSTCYIDYIPKTLVDNTYEYFRYGRCSLCSGFFTGNANFMYKVCDLIIYKFFQYLNMGYGHMDEQLYSPVYFENPELFDVYFGDYAQMITNYNFIYEKPETPIDFFIRNSFIHENYELCFNACKSVYKSYCIGKIDLSEGYLNKLKSYYMTCLEKLIALEYNENEDKNDYLIT